MAWLNFLLAAGSLKRGKLEKEREVKRGEGRKGVL